MNKDDEVIIIARKRPCRPPTNKDDKIELLKKLKKEYIETKMNMLRTYPKRYDRVTDIELIDILVTLEDTKESLDTEEIQEKWNEELKYYKHEFE